MNAFDLIILATMAGAAVGGFRLGFVARVVSWAGAVAGFFGAVTLLPGLLRSANTPSALTQLMLVLGVLLVGAAIGGAIGEVVGHQLRSVLRPGAARSLDHAGGAIAGALGVLVVVWLLFPALAQVPGSMARLARNSEVVRVVQTVAPPPPNTARVLSRLVGQTRFPEVFEGLRPAPDTGPPPASVPVPPEVVARARASTVNVESDGCGGRHEGSGFVVSEDVVVTNAHVVAGATRIRVRKPDGRVLTARPVLFDDDRDLAILEVPGLGTAPLPLGTSRAGTQGAVIGYPGGQDTPRVAPALVQDQITAVGRDIYGQDRTRREVLLLAADLASGDSGAAMIDETGRVIGVAFAIAPDRAATAYALADAELRAALAAPRTPGVGPCL